MSIGNRSSYRGIHIFTTFSMLVATLSAPALACDRQEVVDQLSHLTITASVDPLQFGNLRKCDNAYLHLAAIADTPSSYASKRAESVLSRLTPQSPGDVAAIFRLLRLPGPDHERSRLAALQSLTSSETRSDVQLNVSQVRILLGIATGNESSETRAAALHVVAAAQTERELADADAARLIALVRDPRQSPSVIQEALEASVRQLPDVSTIVSLLKPQIDIASQQQHFDYLQAYAVAIVKMGPQASSLSEDLQRALLALPSSGQGNVLSVVADAFLQASSHSLAASSWIVRNIVLNDKMFDEQERIRATEAVLRQESSTDKNFAANFRILQQAFEALQNRSFILNSELVREVQQNAPTTNAGLSSSLLMVATFIESSPSPSVAERWVRKFDAWLSLLDLKSIQTYELKRDYLAAQTVDDYVGKYGRVYKVDLRPTAQLQSLGDERVRRSPLLTAQAVSIANPVPFTCFSVVAVYGLIFWFFPLWLLRYDSFLIRLSGIDRVPDLAGLILRTIGLAITFNRSAHVLDAWVSKNAKRARAALDQSHLSSMLIVPLPVEIQEIPTDTPRAAPVLAASDLRDHLRSRATRLLISGEGGVGKSTLAYHLATLAIHESPRARLWGHQAIPVVIPSDFDGLGITTDEQFLNFIASQLESFSDSSIAVTPVLVEAMLTSKRLLLIVDGLTEMPQTGLAVVRDKLRDIDVNAVILTTRSEAVDVQQATVTLRPQRVKTSELAPFLHQYVTKRGCTSRFPEDVIASSCQRIQKVMGDSVTPLLVKIYVDMMVDEQDADVASPSLAPSIPKLILEYVGHLNNKIVGNQLPTDAVVAQAKALANACCVSTRAYCSAVAQVDKVKDIFGDKYIEQLAYFERRLNLIRFLGASRDRLRFSVDPVCEYLAALYVVDASARNPNSLMPLGNDVSEFSRVAFLGFMRYIEECVQSDVCEPEARSALTAELTALRARWSAA